MRTEKGFFKDTAYGWDGLSTFIISNILLLLSFGIGLLWLFSKVCLLARNAPLIPDASADARRTWLVAGLCLSNNLPQAEYKTRLDRVLQLLATGIVPDKILILGGITDNNQVSEAKAGADYLQQQGVTESMIILEDRSKHTLENMQHARSLLELKTRSSHNALIISSRYHLYRILTLAKGLGMQLLPVAAEDQLSLNARTCLLVLKEAYFLHWYWSGKLWVLLTGNRHSKARIS